MLNEPNTSILLWTLESYVKTFNYQTAINDGFLSWKHFEKSDRRQLVLKSRNFIKFIFLWFPSVDLIDRRCDFFFLKGWNKHFLPSTKQTLSRLYFSRCTLWMWQDIRMETSIDWFLFNVSSIVQNFWCSDVSFFLYALRLNQAELSVWK